MVLTVPCLSEDTGSILCRVDAHYNHLKTLRAHFVERYAGMGMVREESGTLLLARPGRMRWSYDKPVGKVFLIDGKFAWSYTPGDAQAQRIAAKKLDDLRSPLRFLLGHTVLGKEMDRISVNASGAGYVITGVPRTAGARLARLMLRVNGEGTIQEIKVDEVDGASTDFLFSEIKEDQPIPNQAFVFTVPAGVEVSDGLPPV